MTTRRPLSSFTRFTSKRSCACWAGCACWGCACALLVSWQSSEAAAIEDRRRIAASYHRAPARIPRGTLARDASARAEPALQRHVELAPHHAHDALALVARDARVHHERAARAEEQLFACTLHPSC